MIGICIALPPSSLSVLNGEGRDRICLLSSFRDESHFVEIPDRSLKDYLGYISTWSGFRTYSKTEDGEKLLEDFAKVWVVIFLNLV